MSAAPARLTRNRVPRVQAPPHGLTVATLLTRQRDPPSRPRPDRILQGVGCRRKTDPPRTLSRQDMPRSILPRPGLVPLGPAPLTIGSDQHYRWLESIVKNVLVLNLLDAVFTLWWVGNGLATEANALLEDLVERPLLFVLAKLALVSLGSIFLWRLRRRPLAVIAIFGVFFAYYMVLLHHLRFSAVLLAEVVRGTGL